MLLFNPGGGRPYVCVCVPLGIIGILSDCLSWTSWSHRDPDGFAFVFLFNLLTVASEEATGALACPYKVFPVSIKLLASIGTSSSLSQHSSNTLIAQAVWFRKLQSVISHTACAFWWCDLMWFLTEMLSLLTSVCSHVPLPLWALLSLACAFWLWPSLSVLCSVASACFLSSSPSTTTKQSAKATANIQCVQAFHGLSCSRVLDNLLKG